MVNNLIRVYEDLLRKKLRQWNETANKMRDNAAKNRIAKWTEERYRISIARKNWQKLAHLYYLLTQRRPLHVIRKKLIESVTLRDMADRLRNRFTKTGLDQFKEGIKYVNILKYFKKIFEDIDDVNKYTLLKFYLEKWNNKVRRLRDRDNKLLKAMDQMDKRQLINDVDTVANVETTKRFRDCIPVARAYDFFKTVRERVRRLSEVTVRKDRLLIKIFDRFGRFTEDYLRKIIRKWNDTANKMRDNAAKNRIAKWTEERYRISIARKNWQKLAHLYYLLTQRRPLHVIRKKLIESVTLRDMADRLRNRFTKTGLDQFKEGIKYVNILKYFKKIFEDIDDVNKYTLLKFYLEKWNNKVRRLRDRDNKLLKAMDQMDKRQLINDVDTVANVETTKRFRDCIPVARAYDFFKTIRELEKKRLHLSNYKLKLIRKLVNNLIRVYEDLLRKKLRQWNETANKMRDNAAKNRIAKWTEERYRISIARKNWQKLAHLYYLLTQRRPLHVIRKKLIESVTLRDMADRLRNRFTKTGLDQFKEGIKYVNILKYFKKIFEDIDDVNKYTLLKFYLEKWNNKVRRLRDRDNKLLKAMDQMDKRQLINDVDYMACAEISKRVTDTVPVARAYDFFDKVRDLINRRSKETIRRDELLIKIIDRYGKFTEDYLRRILRKWKETANKLRDEAARNRIANWTEERFRISKARKNWRKLADLYERHIQKRPLYVIRKKLINFITLRDMADKLRNRFTQTGNDQFKEGVKYVNILKYLKKILEDIDDVNKYTLLKYYLNKWNDKAKKLKRREQILREAFDALDLRNLINATNIIKDVSICKRVDIAVPVARAYNFFDRIRKKSEYLTKYKKLAEDLVKSKDDLDGFNKYTLLNKLYKVYYYKVLDNLFNRLNNVKDRYKKYFGDYFLKVLQAILLSKRSDRYNRKTEGEKEAPIKRLLFKGKTDKKIKVPEDRSVLTMLLPSLIKFLNDKFLNHKKWAWDKLTDNDRALKFCKLYKTFSDKTIVQPKRDLVDLLKAEHAYMNGLGAANCDLFKLLRRYWIKLVCDSMLAPSRIYKILYLIKMVMMHKTIAYQRFIRELVRKWRFSAFIQCMSRRKLELMYKNLHVSYLQMANEIFGEKGAKNASVIKEFERLAVKMGIFTNEDYHCVNEENFCEKITKKYVFQPMPLLLEKEGPTQFFASGIEIEDSGENNEDYYVDQELGGETVGKYKQETNKSSSKADKNSSRLSKY